MTKFKQCPNCKTKPSSGIFGASSWRKIYECKKCKKLYCDNNNCGNGRCPDCGSRERTEAGKCWD